MGRGWKRIEPDSDTAPVPYPTESHQGTARPTDRPHQLQRFLGQPVPGAADRRRLRAAAGAAPAGRAHQLCPRSGLDIARTVVETGRPGTGFSASRGRASARFVSLPVRLPASGAGAGRFAWLAWPCQSKHPSYRSATEESLYPKIAVLYLAPTPTPIRTA